MFTPGGHVNLMSDVKNRQLGRYFKDEMTDATKELKELRLAKRIPTVMLKTKRKIEGIPIIIEKLV